MIAESKRWHDIVRLHTEFYDKPAPPPIASGPPPRRAPSTDPERQETDQPQKWTRFSLKKAIEVSESEAAEVAAACEAAFAASQPSQESVKYHNIAIFILHLSRFDTVNAPAASGYGTVGRAS